MSGLLLAALILLSARRRPQAPVGDILVWSSPSQKKAAAAFLNAKVRLDGFKVSLHPIRPGENFWSLANKYLVDLDTICGFNPEMEGLQARLGGQILIPTRRGVLHQVRLHETVKSLAGFYGVGQDALKSVNGVGLFGLRTGQLLFVPGAKPRRLGKDLAAAYEKRRLFRSPLAGRLSSTMGVRHDPFTGTVRHHNGIDIKAQFNEIVGAAAGGTVVFASWNGGFGKCVKIDHRNGYVSLYGHLNAITVQRGQVVRRHQALGRVGTTGRATGAHLHFTIFRRGKAVNPLEYLW